MKNPEPRGATVSSRARPILLPVVLLLGAVLIAGSCGAPEVPTSSLSVMVEQARTREDQAKQKSIEAAVSVYVVEHGRNPDSLQDLVDAGLLRAQDTVDHNGNRLSFVPDDSVGTGTGTTVIKHCTDCGKVVANSSKVGDVCPHCGVLWGYETTSY